MMSARLIAYALAAGALLVLGWQWRARGERIDELLSANATLSADYATLGADAERRVREALTADVPAECPAAMQWLGERGREIARQWEQEGR